MATKITWEDKEGIQNDASIARKNKVMDDDMNEIKQTVNNNADELIEAQENIENLQGGQETAGADIKNLRSRVSILETENTTNKSDISSLKSDNTTNKENILTLQEQVSNKVDKVEGKGLSTNDYTTEEKQKLAGLKNYDDTEIKQNIADIKKEQEEQNANIENNTTKNKEQDELISKLKSALINVETEEAKSLHIEDASEVPAQLKVLGNQEQETREGYNLLNSSLFDLSEVSNYATFNKEDGTITFNGTVNADINIRSLRKQTIKGTGKENIVIKTLGGSLNGTLRLVAQDTDYGNIQYAQIGTSSYTNKLTENIEYNIFSITITSGTVMNNLKLGFMIVNNSDLNKEYEPYGAMPSPDYLSEVVCLGSNKNLFDEDNYIENLTINTDGTFKDDSSFKIIKIPVKSNTVYTLSRSAVEESTANIVYGTSDVEPSANATCTYKILHYNITEIQIETTENTKYICIRKTKANTDYRLFVDFKIEEGDMATSYSPYGQGSTKISKINENLFDSKKYTETTINSRQLSINEVGNVVVNGESQSNSNFEQMISLTATDNTYILIKKLSGSLSGGEVQFVFIDNVNNIKDVQTAVIDSSTDVSVVKLTPGVTYTIARVSVRANVSCTNLELGLQIKLNDDTDTFTSHEEKSVILSIQQEMLEGDYFVKEEDGWKEVHNYSKEIFDGTEQFTVSSLKNTRMVLPIANAKQNPDEILAVSNSFLGVTYNQAQENKLINAICVNNGYLSIDTDGITNVSEFKQTLADKYNAGNPVYIYYKEATPTKLPCTPEQSAVLDEIDNLDLFEGVNNIITAENIALLQAIYIANAQKYVDKEISDIKEQINTINELLSTTGTSSLLLDNLQTDLESEVM